MHIQVTTKNPNAVAECANNYALLIQRVRNPKYLCKLTGKNPEPETGTMIATRMQNTNHLRFTF